MENNKKMNDETITRIEQEISRLQTDRSKAIEANDQAIEAEENRKTGHTDRQAANVRQLTDKKNSVVSAYDQLIERKSVELATARTQKAMREASEIADNEAKATKQKENARRAFVAAGGSPADFE